MGGERTSVARGEGAKREREKKRKGLSYCSNCYWAGAWEAAGQAVGGIICG